MRIFIKIILGVILSFYLFPIGFTFLPPAINTKMILAVLGTVVFIFDNIRIYDLRINLNLVASILIAICFSIICYFAADYNYSDDYSYATYLGSFFVWLSGAYFVGWSFRHFYGEFSFRQLAYYLIAVCVTQCILALLIDNLPFLKVAVDAVVLQGQEFLDDIDRLYGIGASLDTAGVRFSVVLIIAASLLMRDEHVRSNSRIYFLILMSFFIIGIVGNMISRTTVLGFGIGFFYLIYSSGVFKSIIQKNSIKTALIFIVVLSFIIFFAVFIYNNSAEYRTSLRFAFEGFFNWFETGEWRTSSTDKLNKEMWIWPQDTKSWLIGTGVFGNFVYSTDIGYCRFILYSGLIGFCTFALLFVYNAIAFKIKVPHYGTMFLFFGALAFIIWLKVATDIFFIFALFYCIDSFSVQNDEHLIPPHEPSI